MSSTVNVSAAGVVCAIVFHACVTSDPIQPVRMSDTTYVLRFRNGTDICDVTKVPACRTLVDTPPREAPKP